MSYTPRSFQKRTVSKNMSYQKGNKISKFFLFQKYPSTKTHDRVSLFWFKFSFSSDSNQEYETDFFISIVVESSHALVPSTFKNDLHAISNQEETFYLRKTDIKLSKLGNISEESYSRLFFLSEKLCETPLNDSFYFKKQNQYQLSHHMGKGQSSDRERTRDEFILHRSALETELIRLLFPMIENYFRENDKILNIKTSHTLKPSSKNLNNQSQKMCHLMKMCCQTFPLRCQLIRRKTPN